MTTDTLRLLPDLLFWSIRNCQQVCSQPPTLSLRIWRLDRLFLLCWSTIFAQLGYVWMTLSNWERNRQGGMENSIRSGTDAGTACISQDRGEESSAHAIEDLICLRMTGWPCLSAGGASPSRIHLKTPSNSFSWRQNLIIHTRLVPSSKIIWFFISKDIQCTKLTARYATTIGLCSYPNWTLAVTAS